MKGGTISFLADLNRRVSREIGYTTRMEPGVQTCEETLERRMGSCRDSAWLLVQALRNLGFAARVLLSGYLIQLAADEDAQDEPGMLKHDSTDLHAWTEVFLPGAGWIGLDSTSGLFAGEGRIPAGMHAKRVEGRAGRRRSQPMLNFVMSAIRS